MPPLLFLSALRRAVSALPFALLMFSSFAQTATCDISGPATACVGDVSVYHIAVQSPLNYNIEWVTPNGTPMGSDNEMVAVHWILSGTAQIQARIRSAANPANILGVCLYNVVVLTPPNPKIQPEYLPTGLCGSLGIGSSRPVSGFCGGSQAVFFPNGSDGDYTWEVSGAYTDHTVDDNGVLTVELGASGQVTICLTETNAAGCSRQVCESYDIYAPPVSNFTELSQGAANPIAVCRGEQLVFLGTFSDPNNLPLGSWFWEIKNSSGIIVGIGTEKDFAFTFEEEETYAVTMYATNCLGCGSEPVSVVVEVNDAIVPEIICPSVVCQSSEPAQYCAVADCGAFLWTVTGGTIQGPDNEQCLNVVWDMPQANGYGTVTLETAQCQGNVCPLATVVEVPVIPIEQAIKGPPTLCSASASDVTYSVPFWPGAVYTWSRVIDNNQSGGLVIGTAKGNEYQVDLVNFYGTFRVLVTIEHPIAGCVSSGELAVFVQNYSIQGGSYCYGSDVPLQISPAPAPTPYEVFWKVQETNWSQQVSDAPGVTLPFSAFGGSGNFTVKAVIAFGGNQMFECDELVAAITIRDVVPPVTDILGARRMCPGKTYTYSALPASPGTIDWAVSGGTPAAANGSVVNITWTSGQAPYSATVTRTYNGCTSGPFTLEVADISSEQLAIVGDAPVCEEAMGTYTANIDGADLYFWSINPFVAGSIVSGQGTPEITVQWHQFANSNTKVRLTANVCGTNQTVELPVNVTKNAVNIQCPTLGTNDCRICQGNEVLFTLDNNSGASYEWFVNTDSNDDPPASTTNTLLYTFDEPGTHFVRVRMTGPPSCPGVFEDALLLDVLANPKPVISASSLLNCAALTPLTLNATTYPGATSETFFWSHNGAGAFPPIYTPTPPPNGPQLIVSSAEVNDYLGTYSVFVIRAIDDLLCTATSNYGLNCADFELLPNYSPDVIFSDWVFNLGVGEGDCPPEDANECGYIIVKGDLNGRSFLEVEEAEWRVSDPNNALNPVDVFPIHLESALQGTPISVFSKAGFYPATLRVKFLGEPNYYSDLRTLEIPLKPDLHWSYRCSAEPGKYDLILRDLSELVPHAVIHKRFWDISIDGTPLPTIVDEDGDMVQIIQSVPAGASVTVSLTPFARTAGADKPDMLYYCTYCIQIEMPELPVADVLASQSTVCVGNPVQFEAVVNPNDQIIKYDWDFGDGSGSGSNAPVRVYPFTGDYVVTLTATTSRGCAVVATEQIHVQSNELAGFIDVMFDECLASAALMYHPSSNSSVPVSWLWSPGSETTEAIMAMTTGVYDVTVTDGIGCTYSPPFVAFTLPNLFSGGIQGDLTACAGESVSFFVNGTGGFSYVWSSDLPGFQYNNATAFAPAVPDGTYSVMVTAERNGQSCISISEMVVVRPEPSNPVLDVDYECRPFRAHIATNPGQNVAWSLQGAALGFGANIWAYQGGQYYATATNQYGCMAISNTTVADPVNVAILSGCYTLCDTLLENDCIVLPAPSGSFTSWEWVLLPSTTLGSGTGQINALCLTAEMEGEIVLRVRQNYQNSNPPPLGSVTTCEDESEPFCLDVLECLSCPDLTIMATVPEMLCILGDPSFDEQVVKITITLHLPSGYRYCGNLPMFQGGYLNPPVTVSDFGTFVRFEGYLHVTDQESLEAGILGYILLCDIFTGEQCPAKFQIRPFKCEEVLWCMYMTTITYNYQAWPQTVTVKFTFPGHYVTGPNCDITQYSASVIKYSDTGPTLILAQQTYPPQQPPANLQHSISFTMPIDQFNQLGCVQFSYHTNCELGCTFYPCFGQGGLPRPERGTESDSIALGNYDYLGLQPNPAIESTRLTYGIDSRHNHEDCYITIRNSHGQIISRIPLRGHQGSEILDSSDWPSGMYSVTLVASGRVLRSKKLLVVR